jgi:hypothetical protein
MLVQPRKQRILLGPSRACGMENRRAVAVGLAEGGASGACRLANRQQQVLRLRRRATATMTMPTASIDPMESSGTAAAYTLLDRVA